MNAEQEKRKSNKAVPLIVLGILAGMVGLFALGLEGNKDITTGTIQFNSPSIGEWTSNVDQCHTRHDMLPAGHTPGGTSSFYTRALCSKQTPDYGIFMFRDTMANLGDDDIAITSGPHESPTQKDEQELAKYTKNKWFLQIAVPKSQAPIPVAPHQCARFHFDASLDKSRAAPPALGGSLDIDCTLTDGTRIVAKVDYEGCP